MPVKDKKPLAPRIEKQQPFKYKTHFLLACIVFITFLCYSTSLHNQFTNWDDNRFIVNNAYIHDLSPGGLKMLLLQDVTRDYYNPVTMLSYALNYHFSKLSPEAYYATNIVLHILNTILIYFLALMLLKAMEQAGYGKNEHKDWLAACCALIFAIHPMHVESVSWAAERKDVLYGLFYLGGLITYVKYTRQRELKWLGLTVAMYVLSLLSKPMAVVFPLSLLSLDILLRRDESQTKTAILKEKLVFVFISIISGLWTIHLQQAAGAIASSQEYNFLQRILFASYGFTMYSLKAFIPFGLCSYYPYPPIINSHIAFPFIFYISPLIAITILVVPLLISYRRNKTAFRIILAGLSFYVFNLMFVLQLISSGPNIMAERYSYIPYFGLFFALIYFIPKLLKELPSFKIYVQSGIGVYTLLLSIVCYNRTQVWHDSETLWKDVINKYPGQTETPYNSLGAYYYENGDMDNAYTYFNEAINLHSNDPNVYRNMAALCFVRKEYKQSFEYFNRTIELDSNNIDTYINLAISYSALGDYNNAFRAFNQASKIDPNSERLIESRAYTYLNQGQFDNAISDYTHAIQLDPNQESCFMYRGQAEYNKGVLSPAIDDFKKAYSLSPSNDTALFYVSISYRRLNDFRNALQYAAKAQQGGFPLPQGYIEMLQQNIQSPSQGK
jgi:tetratricopeptide (TPR) repeat protein